MRFRSLFAVSLFIILGSHSKYFAQDTNTVYYKIYMEKTVSSYYTAKERISSGIFKEGSGFVIPEAELPDSYPADFSMFQNLYNALVGGYFSIDYGAINKDIVLELFIRNLDPETGKYKQLGEDGDTLFTYFEIRIVELPDSSYDPNNLENIPDSSYFPVDSSYYFNEGKYARLTLPKSDYFLNFLDSIGISRNDSLSFAFMQYDDWDSSGEKTNDWNGNGIEITDTQDSITFKAIHLSKVGGGRGRIHKRRFEDPTSVGGIQIIPEDFLLEQNYPNPFNPTTVIKYQIPNVKTQNIASQQVQLKVYNILGEKVRTLVNKKQFPGNYEVTFDASDLASGIYIYTLRSNNLLKTRKMILMK